MSIEQVNLDIMNVNLTINTPSEEKNTLIQAVEMLNKKSEAIKENGRIIGTDKIVVMAALNVVHDLLKVSLKDDLAIGEFQRKIKNMSDACEKALSRLEHNN
ncbi:cell division protein ZapA [Neisseria iguanae]|uniref:Cell division protein ZapA n=1 Tax=Neisseria iguanae TaxID=90242 RepID=A0A2P7TZ59_9NEIS|nr:cell division protein ZapA [Neisseria iguanae]PSJ80012.1 cell division protein ZapA [Neisseria iguanae]